METPNFRNQLLDEHSGGISLQERLAAGIIARVFYGALFYGI